MNKEPSLSVVAAALPDGDAFLAGIAGPFRRACRQHPLRGQAQGWASSEPVPWSAAGFFHDPGIDPADRLDYHTGCVWPQDAASQLPVVLLDPQPGEIVIDCCAAPGSKTTQIGLALGDAGLVIACDAVPARRRILPESLARQGVACGLVTPMPVTRLAERHPGVADAVLVDAPCSGHAERSAKQITRMAKKQLGLLTTAARLVAPAGRLVYSTCTPYRDEDEGVVERFLAAHPGWTVDPVSPAGVDGDDAGLGGCRLWPQRQGTEPFFAIRLRAPVTGARSDLQGDLPAAWQVPEDRQGPAGWHLWQRGEVILAATPQVAQCPLPSEARGLLLGRSTADGIAWQPWAVQALVSRGAAAQTVSQDEALTLWRGEALPAQTGGAWLRTEHGAPLAALDQTGTRLRLPARLFRPCKA